MRHVSWMFLPVEQLRKIADSRPESYVVLNNATSPDQLNDAMAAGDYEIVTDKIVPPVKALREAILATSVELKPDGKIAVHITGGTFGDTGGTGGVFEKSLELDSLEQLNQLQMGKQAPLHIKDFKQRSRLSFWKDVQWINKGFTMKTLDEARKEDCSARLR